MAKISNSNTKAEILTAYEALLGKLNAQQKENSTLAQELQKKRQEVDNVKQKLQGGATANIQALRRTLNEQLDQIEQGLSKEQQTFTDLQHAIGIERQTLEEIYQIKTEAQSLEALTITHRQAMEKMAEEKEQAEADLDEKIDAKRLAWKREQNEYEYELKLKRRKEEDQYQSEKAKKEQELAEKLQAFDQQTAQREAMLKEREDELSSLKSEVESFAARVKQAVETAENQLKAQLTSEFEFKRQLETKDLQSKIELLQATIESMQTKITEQQTRIESLTHKADDASIQIKEIAFKAIEQSSYKPQPIIVDRGGDSKQEG